MSIRAGIKHYFDMLVDARFRRTADGQLAFYPWGRGRGRLVPDAATEAVLRQATRRMMLALFAIAVPLLSAAQAILQPKGLTFLAYVLGACATSVAAQLYPYAFARGLPLSTERLTMAGAAMQSLRQFSTRFLMFGLITSLGFTAIAILMLAWRPAPTEIDPLAMWITLAVFVPLAAVYAVALIRRLGARTTMLPR